jgi:hypothetical protein
MAVGTRVWVNAGGLRQMREISAGRGHVGHQDDVRLVFGLGAANRVDYLEVRWSGRDGRTQVFADVPADTFQYLREGGTLRPDRAK